MRLVVGTVVVAGLLAWAGPAVAADFPKPTGYLVDDADAVPDAEQQQLEAELAAYASRSTHQVAVAIVKSTGGDSIEDYANDLFGDWGVGSAERDDGVLIVVATEDRQLRIEVGRGLEGKVTDIQAADIVRDEMVPELRAGRVAEAVRVGERGVRTALGDPTPSAGGESAEGFGGFGGGEPAPRSQGSGIGLLPLLVLGLVAFGLLSSFGGRRRRRRGGMFFPVFLGSGWGGGGWGGGGGNNFGGGGFGGFGGGSSGGGGASGSW